MRTTTRRFDMALSALVGAFFTNTLAKGACTACAVGNIVSKANGVKIKSFNAMSGEICGTGVAEMTARGVQMGMPNLGVHSWMHLFMTHEQSGQLLHLTPHDQENGVNCRGTAIPRSAYNEAYMAILPTGYSADELALVEKAFEDSTKISHFKYSEHTEDEIKDDQYNGLVAVVDVLCKLDGISKEDAAGYKSAFDYVTPQFAPEHPEMVESILAEV